MAEERKSRRDDHEQSGGATQATRSWSGATIVELPPLSLDFSRRSDDLPYAPRPKNKRSCSPSSSDTVTTYASYAKHARLTSESSDVYYSRFPPSSPGPWEMTSTDPLEVPDIEEPEDPPGFSSSQHTVLTEAGIEATPSPRKVLVTRTSSTREYDSAVSKIRGAVDNCAWETRLFLEGQDLDHVPHEIKDLQYMVATGPGGRVGPPQVELILSDNRITTLPPVLFDVSCIKFLSLRNNRLTSIPPAIAKLTSLTELSLGGNDLRFLPCEILDLPKLKTLSVTPNPFISKPSDARKAPLKLEGSFVGARTAVQAHLLENHQHRNCPSLVETCLVALGSVPQSERDGWGLTEHLHELLKDGSRAVDNAKSCGQCRRPIVRGVGYAYEWWGADVVFRRPFCTLACYQQWENSLTT
uniref:ARAD1C16588p n=1 Tax=Blastobotrys adeninivorans TaxID=409370 RepID=A0A060T0Z8_BLAAD